MVLRIDDLARGRRFEPPAADLPDFGATLRDLRLRAGLSQNELARRAAIDVAYVNRLERGVERAHPSRHVIVNLALAVTADLETVDDLLASAGYLPASVVEAGGWSFYRRAQEGNVRVLETRLERLRAENVRLCREVVALRRAAGPRLLGGADVRR